jgi:hypothetical protein
MVMRDANDSPYYPPRAPWYSAARALWFDLRRGLRLETLSLPNRMSFCSFLAGLTVPGFAFLALELRAMARVAMAVCPVALLIWQAALGYAISTIALATVLSIHVTGTASMLLSWAEAPGLRIRLLTTALTLAALSILIYLPLQNTLSKHLASAMRTRDQVIVVKPTPPRTLRRGDVVAYRINSFRANNAVIAAGFGIERVLGVAGDRVEFFGDRVEINGLGQSRGSTMPTNGMMVIPQKHWLIWPRLEINMRGDARVDVAGALLQIALVQESQLIGTPYRRWFGRSQVVPPDN